MWIVEWKKTEPRLVQEEGMNIYDVRTYLGMTLVPLEEEKRVLAVDLEGDMINAKC